MGVNSFNLKNLDLAIEKFGKDYINDVSDGKHIRYKCPFCLKRRGKVDNDGKLYVNLSSGNLGFYCFKCGAKGRLRRKIDNDVYEKLSRFFDRSDDIREDESGENMFYLPNVRASNNSVAYEYLRNRGISDDLIEYYDIRLGIDDMFGRVVVPNITYGGEGIWTDIYSARSYINQVPKYKYPEGSKKSKVVFNMHRTKKGDCIRVVEGVITAIAAGKNAICIYGSHPSEEQLAMISDMEYEEIDCVLDNDPAGRSGNLMLAEELVKRSKCGKVFMVTMPEGIDAADMGHDAFEEYVRLNRSPYYSSLYGRISMFCKERNRN